ncbi:HAD family hydrolase [Niallia sp. 01092]|uniref:HAD family hydrolase n=1 Tax=unclassified Niallia TaxID=2837522 RepID=UPI003FD60BE0
MSQNNKMFDMVKEFHEAFGHEVAKAPTALNEKTALNRAVWTGEELVEFLYATANGNEESFNTLFAGFLSGLNDAAKKILKEKKPVEDVLVAQMDALTDIEYFNQGSFVIAGVKPFNLFKIVQDANMGKLFEDGKPRYREEDGKIIKPPHWEEQFAPEAKLKKEIEKQKSEEKQ